MHQKISSEWQLLPLEEWSGNNKPLPSALLGILACSGTIMILLHGAGLGLWSSAIVLIGPTAYLVGSGRFRNTIWDTAFALFIAWMAISTAVNGLGPPKEEALLILTLAAYPAARLSGTTGRGFFAVLGAVSVLGLVSTAVALATQWNDPHGKPLVFGEFDAAPTQIFICVALLLMGIVASRLERRWLIAGYVIAAIAFVILGASLVRFSFMALIGVMICEAILSPRTRSKALVAVVIISASWGAGYYARTTTAADLAASLIAGAATAPGTSNCADVNPYSSISIRKKLLSDAVSALPKAGFFGHGLSSFAGMTCLGIEPHVTPVQIIIEFGWPASILLLCVVVGSFLQAARFDRAEARFAVMALLFATALTLAHGDLARDGMLFLFLGYLVRIVEPPP